MRTRGHLARWESLILHDLYSACVRVRTCTTQIMAQHINTAGYDLNGQSADNLPDV